MTVADIHSDLRTHFTHADIPNGKKQVFTCLMQLVKEKKITIVMGNRYIVKVRSSLSKLDILRAWPHYKSSYDFYPEPREDELTLTTEVIKKSERTLKSLAILEISIGVVIVIMFVVAAMQWWR